MAVHGASVGQYSIGGGEVHDPLGSFRVGALSLVGNNGSAYEILDPNDGITPRVVFNISTTTGASVMTLGDATLNTVLVYSGTSLRMGGDTAASPPASVTLRGCDASGSNHNGSNLIVRPGSSTGTGVGGYYEVDLCPSGSSGSTLNTAYERFRIDPANGWWRHNATSSLSTATWAKTGTATTTDGTTTQVALSIPIGSIVSTGGGWLEVWVSSVQQTTLHTAVWHNWVRFSVSGGTVTVVTSTQDVADHDGAIATVAVTVAANAGNIEVHIVGVAALTIIHTVSARWQVHA